MCKINKKDDFIDIFNYQPIIQGKKMKVINRFAWKFTLCAVLFTTANCVKADFWRWTRPFRGPDQKIQTLIVTGNYSESRLLAELIQTENRQPILLVPAANSDKIFFMPPQRRSKALQVPYNELTNFINFIGAKQIIILGNEKYVSQKYTEKIKANQIVWRISGDNWKKVAASIGKLLNLTNLSSDYNDLFDKLKSEVNYQRTGEDPQEQPAFVEDSTIASTTDTPVLVDQHSTTEPIELIDASQK